MTVKTHVLKVFLDRKGTLEIEALQHGTSEADRIAETLAIESFRALDFLCSAIRAEGLDEAARDRVRAWAAREGHTLEETGDLGPLTTLDPEGVKPHPTTIDAVHEHSMEPSRKEKILVPALLLGLAGVVLLVGLVIFDHVNARYVKVATLHDVVLYANLDHPVPAGLGALLDPDDAGYVKTDVRSWSLWFDRAAVTGEAFLYAPDLPVTVEELVKGEDGTGARLTFLFDLRQSEPPRYRVTSIERGGVPTEYFDFDVEILPLPSAELPPGNLYPGDGQVESGEEATFADLERLAANGYLETTPEGLVLRSRRYRVDLTGVDDPALARLVAVAVLTGEESAGFEAAMQPRPRVVLPSSKRVTVYGTLVERHRPGARPDGTIGLLQVDGVAFGNRYVPGS